MKKKLIIICILGLNINLFANKIVSKIGTEFLYKSDVEKVFALKFGAKKYSEIDEKFKSKIIENLSSRLYILNEAKQENIEEEKEFEKLLDEAKKDILIRLYLKDFRKNIQVDNKEIKKYYSENLKEKYTQVKVKTIVHKSKTKIKKLIKELELEDKSTLKETFERLAKKYSQHPRAGRGGEIGFIRYHTMAYPFGKEAFSLKENSINHKVFKTTLGYHIVYLEKYETKKFEEVKEEIKELLTEKMYRSEFKDLLKNLKIKYAYNNKALEN